MGEAPFPIRLLAETGGKTYRVTAWAGGRFVLPEQGPDSPFACLIWDHGFNVPAEEQLAVARVLVDSGCRYAVCGGHDCDGWHDVMDHAAVFRDLDQEQEGPLVMTTWHEGEAPDEVAWFFLNLTDFEEVSFRDYLILHVGTGSDQEALDAAVRDEAFRHTRPRQDGGGRI